MADEDKKAVINDFLKNERWRGAFGYIENSYLLNDKIGIAVQYFDQYPLLISEGGLKLYQGGCNHQNKFIAERRVTVLSSLVEEGHNNVSPLLELVKQCERQRIAKEVAALENSRREKQARKEEVLKRLQAYSSAKKNAELLCTLSECERYFSLAQIFVNENSDMKIQVSTDTVVETYNPTDDRKVGMTIYNIPLSQTNGKVKLKLSCKTNSDNDKSFCMALETNLYEMFKPFILSF